MHLKVQIRMEWFRTKMVVHRNEDSCFTDGIQILREQTRKSQTMPFPCFRLYRFLLKQLFTRMVPHRNKSVSMASLRTQMIVFSSRVIWNFLHGASKHTMQSLLQAVMIRSSFGQTLEPNRKRNLNIKHCVFRSGKPCVTKASNCNLYFKDDSCRDW